MRYKRMVIPVFKEKLKKRSRIRSTSRQGAVESEISIWAIMSVFYIGTGAFDIGKVTEIFEYQEESLGSKHNIAIHPV